MEGSGVQKMRSPVASGARRDVESRVEAWPEAMQVSYKEFLAWLHIGGSLARRRAENQQKLGLNNSAEFPCARKALEQVEAGYRPPPAFDGHAMGMRHVSARPGPVREKKVKDAFNLQRAEPARATPEL